MSEIWTIYLSAGLFVGTAYNFARSAQPIYLLAPSRSHGREAEEMISIRLSPKSDPINDFNGSNSTILTTTNEANTRLLSITRINNNTELRAFVAQDPFTEHNIWGDPKTMEKSLLPSENVLDETRTLV